MTKKILILFILLGLFMPFILISDLYPFFRLGMFAEPIQDKIQTEHFLIHFIDNKGKKHTFLSQSIGFEEGHFQYIIRYYVYQHKSKELLGILHSKTNKNTHICQEWFLTKIIVKKDKNNFDHIEIAKWKPF